MNDILDWAINLPNIFLPIAENIVEFFNKPLIEIADDLLRDNWWGEQIEKVIEFILDQFGLNITVFDALLGSGLVLVLSLTLAKWIIGIIQ